VGSKILLEPEIWNMIQHHFKYSYSNLVIHVLSRSNALEEIPSVPGRFFYKQGNHDFLLSFAR